MIEIYIVHTIAFLYLLAGSISDIKCREVADWANYGLIAAGLSVNLIFSLVLHNWGYILHSVLGFAAFLILALLMFYTGQWGGGDSKMLMGLGALYGLGFNWGDSSFLAFFLLNTLIAGAFYGIGWSVVIAIINRKKFMKEYTIIASHVYVKTVRIVIYVLVPVVVLAQFFVHSTIIKVMILTLFFMLSLSFYLWIVIKAVEKSCMFKYVTPDKLTEGDWIAKDVRYNGKYITGPKDLGIEKKQILVLQKLYRAGKIKNILIKEGIPFVPSFLLGWIMTLSLGNVLGLILG